MAIMKKYIGLVFLLLLTLFAYAEFGQNGVAVNNITGDLIIDGTTMSSQSILDWNSSTSKVCAQTLIVPDPTNSIVYWYANPLATSGRITAIRTKCRYVNATGTAFIVKQTWNHAWDQSTLVLTNAYFNTNGISYTSFSTTNIASTDNIGISFKDIGVFGISNVVQVDILFAKP